MLGIFYMIRGLNYDELMGITSWLRVEKTFVVVFLRFRRALQFVLSDVSGIADRNESVLSEPKLNA